MERKQEFMPIKEVKEKRRNLGYVLINRDIFNEYLEQFHEPAKK